MTDPSPCPCCGSERVTMVQNHPPPGEFPKAIVQCSDCRLNVYVYHEVGRRRWIEPPRDWAQDAMVEAVTRWNRRPA